MPRRGALYFNGRFLKYPPAAFNFLKSIPRAKRLRFCFSYLSKFTIFPGKKKNYEEAMQRTVGKEIYEAFYKDFSKKLWGIDPKEISFDGTKRRITFLNLKSMWRIISGRTGYFLYPQNGIGEIAKKMEDKILSNGGEIRRGAEIKKVLLNNRTVQRVITEDSMGRQENAAASSLLSTIPIDSLFTMCFNGDKPTPLLTWRGARILYIHINDKIERENETFYFPSMCIKLGRVSDISKYSPYLNLGLKGTLLTVEIPLFSSDRAWSISDTELLRICLDDLIKVNIIKNNPEILNYFSIKLDRAYPVYKIGWKDNFSKTYNELDKIENLFSVGRKGLFLHCNIDHCILQGLKLSNFILKGNGCAKKAWGKELPKVFKFYARD